MYYCHWRLPTYRRLQRNPPKTELILFGSHHHHHHYQASGRLQLTTTCRYTSWQCGHCTVPVDVVRDLGVTFDSQLTMQRHVNKVASACFHHIRRLKQIRRLVGPEVTATLVSAFVLSKLDYCNAILAGLPKSTIAPLQRAQNAAARLIACLAPRDHVTSTLRQLLPVHFRIKYTNFAYWCTIGPHLASTILPHRHCNSNSYHQFTIATSSGSSDRYEKTTTHTIKFRPTCIPRTSDLNFLT